MGERAGCETFRSSPVRACQKHLKVFLWYFGTSWKLKKKRKLIIKFLRIFDLKNRWMLKGCLSLILPKWLIHLCFTFNGYSTCLPFCLFHHPPTFTFLTIEHLLISSSLCLAVFPVYFCLPPISLHTSCYFYFL